MVPTWALALLFYPSENLVLRSENGGDDTGDKRFKRE